MSITDPNIHDQFASAMEEIHTKQLTMLADLMDMAAEFSQSHKQFVKSAIDSCVKKCKEDDILFETIQTAKRDLKRKSASLQEKRHDISEVTSEIQEKEMQKEDIIQKIEKLKEVQIMRKELIATQNKANKDRLKNLQKARYIFQDHLGLEIRTILRTTESNSGQKVQFVFRNINMADLDSAYIVTVGMKENGQYEVESSDPPLECLASLESRLQESNKLGAFLANVRKEFISQTR